MLGYRVIQGGRGIRIPIFERVDRIDLTNMIIDVRVSNAYSKGGIPLTVHAVANIKIASHQPRLDNALERMLGKSRDAIMTIARETLEGNLRGVLAGLTPEEVNEDRVSFERALLEEADLDLGRLGLTLDTLTIQSVSDDVNYLNSIGRQRNAELMRDASIAEAATQAQSAVAEATNYQKRRIAQITAQLTIVEAESKRRIVEAQTRGQALIAEARSSIAAQKAKALAERSVQEQRVEQVRRQLMADVHEPAKAAMKAMQAKAIGDSAPIVEDGRASASALSELFQIWYEAGDNAREIFIGHKLDIILKTLLSTIGELKVDKMTVIDSSVAQIDHSGSGPIKAASAVEQNQTDPRRRSRRAR